MLRDGTVNASYNDDAIYTPGVMVFKDDNRMLLLPRDQWMKLDVITLPAPNLLPKSVKYLESGAVKTVDFDRRRTVRNSQKACKAFV